MLSRIETLYLGILRVVILIIATLALLAAVLGAVGALPALARQLGWTKQEVRGGTLGEFVAEKKLTSSSVTPTSEEQPAEAGSTVDTRIAAAARTVHAYVRNGKTMTVAQWQTGFIGTADQVATDRRDAYLDGIVRLADQLKASKGKRLTEPQVAELFDWNLRKFNEAAGEQDTKAAMEGARAWLTLYAAGAAFITFILVAFAFLFVKIERSLRVVRTVNVEGDHA